MRKSALFGIAALALAAPAAADEPGLWSVYDTALKGAKYIDLSHVITPTIPVWPGFGDSTFSQAQAGADLGAFAAEGDTFTYDKDGFEATAYVLMTDQLGTQLDPSAHWAP
jgi:kynurenine formamidase